MSKTRLIFLISITFGGCEAEKDFVQKSNNNDISFKQFKDETGLYDFKTTFQIGNHQLEQNAMARNADGSYELNDFNVSIEYIKKLEYDGEKSYTFRVYPKEERSNKREKHF